jgi:DNA replication protein DnaD
MTEEEEDLLDLLNTCIEKVNDKIQELIKSMLIEGEKLEESKKTVGYLLSHVNDLNALTCFLYGQIENMEHKIDCHEKFKKLDYDPSWKYKKTEGDSSD